MFSAIWPARHIQTLLLGEHPWPSQLMLLPCCLREGSPRGGALGPSSHRLQQHLTIGLHFAGCALLQFPKQLLLKPLRLQLGNGQ